MQCKTQIEAKLLTEKSETGKMNTDQHIQCISAYNQTVNLNKTLEENWDIFSTEETTKRTFLPKYLRVPYKHANNIGQKLVWAKLKHPIKVVHRLETFPGPDILTPNYPSNNISCCNHFCGTCRQLSAPSHYYSFQTKIHYEIQKIYSCDTTCSIYLLECSHSSKHYVGETSTTIRAHMYHHQNSSKTVLNRPIYSHLKEHNLNFKTFIITIIDKVTDLLARKNKMYYVKLLKTQVLFGLNVIKKD